MKILKSIPRSAFILSLTAIIASAGLGSTKTISFSTALILEMVFAAIAFVSFGAMNDLTALEKSLGSRKTKGTKVNTHNKYTPSPLDYASSFSLFDDVITTEEYGDGAGYHCWIDKIDKKCKGRPYHIRMHGSDKGDWVSIDEIRLEEAV